MTSRSHHPTGSLISGSQWRERSDRRQTSLQRGPGCSAMCGIVPSHSSSGGQCHTQSGPRRCLPGRSTRPFAHNKQGCHGTASGRGPGEQPGPRRPEGVRAGLGHPDADREAAGAPRLTLTGHTAAWSPGTAGKPAEGSSTGRGEQRPDCLTGGAKPVCATHWRMRARPARQDTRWEPTGRKNGVGSIRGPDDRQALGDMNVERKRGYLACHG
jgi:hypothetical protein